MTPLATKVARELTLPKKDRTFDDRAKVLDLFDQEMHCFEVSALSKSVNAVLDDPYDAGEADECWTVWRDIESMLPRMFLPSPVTWLEMMIGRARIACVIREQGGYFSLATVHDSERGPFSLQTCRFRARGVLEAGDRIEVEVDDPPADEDAPGDKFDLLDRLGSLDPGNVTPQQIRLLRVSEASLVDRLAVLERRVEVIDAGLSVLQMANRFIGTVVLTLDLLNTPGLVGLKQREPHRKLARQLRSLGIGRYPLLAWSEVVVKCHTRSADDAEHETASTFRKCLHFVRSHLRHYRDGHVTLIPAHWRGDPALGIKRTRYRAEPPAHLVAA